jgi:MFS family permease
VGYTLHLTETCEADHPDLITQVMTTPATTQDRVMGPAIQQDLADRDVLPSSQSNLVPLWLVTWMLFFAQAGVFTFLKTYVMATGFGTLGAFFTVYTLTAIVQRLALGWVPDRLGLTRVLGPALLIFVVGLLLLSVAASAWEVWTAGFFCGIGHGYAFPVLLGLVSRRTRVTERGTGMAIYTTIDDGAVLVAGPVLGFLIETMGYARCSGV